jgi:DNA-binding MarR family transcriptional regulator
MSNLGTRLRHLIELLDGGVNASYADSAPGYRARYTPVVRALDVLGYASIKDIADHAGITHSAVSQTVAQMHRAGLVRHRPSNDARERAIEPTAKLEEMRAAINRQWRATAQAASALDAELPTPLAKTIEEAIAALEQTSFAERIGKALQKEGKE